MAIFELFSDADKQKIAREYEEYYQRISRSYGPYTYEKEPAPSIPLTSEEAIQKILRKIPKGVELAQDGSKTALIIHEFLRTELWGKLKSGSEEERTSLIDELGHAISEVLQLLSEKDKSAELMPFESLTAQDEWEENSYDPLARWLLAQRIPSKLNGDSKGTPAGDIRRIPRFSTIFADSVAPFFVLLQPFAEVNVLTSKTVYWSDTNLTSILFRNIPLKPPYWDEERLQFTLRDVFILVVNGVLRGKMWSKKIAKFMKYKKLQGSLRDTPALVVLADGFENPKEDEAGISASGEVPGKDYYTLVLMAPYDYAFDKESPSVQRPLLKFMAGTFGAEVVDFWTDPESMHSPARRSIAPDVLGRAQWVAVDRHRAVLAPVMDISCSPLLFTGGWEARLLNVFALRPEHPEKTLAEAEALVRWRIEIDHGFVAGAGATLYRLGDQLLSQPGSWIRHATGQALQAPLRTLLSMAVEQDSQEWQEVMDWVNLAPRTFRITSDVQEVKEQEIRTAQQKGLTVIETRLRGRAIILGEAQQLGLVTPLPEIWRIINRAAEGLMDWRFRQISTLE